MSELGKIVWSDLTVPEAQDVRDFYQDVIGWEVESFEMGDYEDYCMKPASGEAVAGVCHARGSNANVPPQWMMYVTVESVMVSVAKCTARGGEVVDGPRSMSGKLFAVIRDPAGAVMAIIEP